MSRAEGGPPVRSALVTGAAGFIGSHLVEHLLASGWKVRGLDDCSVGRAENLRAVAGSPDFDLVEGSVLDERLTRTLVAGATHVFHLAGRLGGRFVERHPEQVVLETVRATQSVLAALREQRTPLFFASTSEIYGHSPVQPLAEDADIIVAPPTNPRSSYALGKATAELLVNDHVRARRGPAVIGRLFNTVGPRQSGAYGMVVPTFINAARANGPIVVHGTGEQTRCFTYVGDAVAAIEAVLTAPGSSGHTINIGSRQEISIAELAQLVVKLTASSSEIRYVTYESAHGAGARDILRRVPDTAKLSSLAGRECATPLEVSIRAILAHDGQVC